MTFLFRSCCGRWSHNVRVVNQLVVRSSNGNVKPSWNYCIDNSKVIKIPYDKEPCYLYNKLIKCYFEKKRHPGVGMFFDSS
jgi:hypothetical protein